jgi:tetratricopeptide (TPR) repeat protein
MFSVILTVMNIRTALRTGLLPALLMGMAPLPAADLKPAPDQLLTPAGEKLASAQAHFVAAHLLETEGKMREALDHYLALLRNDSSDPELVAHAADLAFNYRGLDTAVKLLEDNIVANPAAPAAHVSLIDFCLTHADQKNNLLAKAVSTTEEALKKFPKNAETHITAVRLQLAVAQIETDVTKSKAAKDRAIQIVEQAAKGDANEPAYWLGIGRIAQEVWPLADGENRKTHLSKINAIMEKALQAAVAAKNEEAELNVADYFLLTAQLERSLAVCQKTAERNGSMEAKRRIVRLYDALEKPDDSLKALEDLVSTNPQDIEHRRMLAGVYFQRSMKEIQADQAELGLKHRTLAIENLEMALQAGGGDMQDYLQVCALMRFTKDTEKFSRFTQRAAQLYPEEPRILFFDGVAQIYKKKYAEAAKLFDRAAKLAESSAPERLDHDFYFQQGIALERSGGLDEAARKFQKSIQLTPQERPEVAAQAMNYLGYMWADKGQHLDQAGELIRKANELSPSTPSYIDSLGWLLFQQGKYEEALKELLRGEALQKDWEADDAEMPDHTARTYEKLNNKAKAEEYWRRTLDLKPTNEEVRQRAERALGIKPEPKKAEPEKDK